MEKDASVEQQEVKQKNNEIIGHVVKTKGERAIVEIYEKNSKKKSKEVLDVSNPINAKIGYIVKIEWRRVSKSRDKFMLVMPPILSLLAGAIFSYNLAGFLSRKNPVDTVTVMAIGVSIWTALGIFYSFRYWRDTYGRGLQPTIMSIIGRQ